jgi:FPC/CPF motif-containing protein YcgG
MVNKNREEIIEAYHNFIGKKDFACVAARAALAKEHIKCFVADHMACPKDDAAILEFLYHFIDYYRETKEPFHSAAIIFKGPDMYSEDMYESLLWQRLQALSNMDANIYGYDQRVDADPASPKFSFSLKEEAFFIIGLHPSSSRPTRQFGYPAIVFNPHAEFEKLRSGDRYDKLKTVVRKRDVAYSGTINPMLDDFGTVSEVYQYSGKKYSTNWQCPLQINHARISNNPTP